MKRILLLGSALALAAALIIWIRRVDSSSLAIAAVSSSSPAATPTAHAPSCACGHDEPHDHVVAQGSGASAATEAKSNEAWTAELRGMLEEGLSPADLHSTLVELVGTGGARAMEIALAVGRSELERHDLAALTAHIWGSLDPAGAWRWALRGSPALDQPDRDPVYAAVLNGIAFTHPELIARYVEQDILRGTDAPWPAAPTTYAAIAALMHVEQFQSASEILARWHHELTPEQLEPAVFGMLASAWSNVAPAEAGAWLLALPDSDRRASGLEALASNWAESAPEAALDWAAALPPQTGRDAVLASAFERWVDQDSLGAAQWVARHEAEPAADQMIHTLLTTSTVAAKHPQQAVQWADLIAQPARRTEALKNALHFWARADASAAAAFVESNPKLNAAEKAELLAIIRLSPTLAEH